MFKVAVYKSVLLESSETFILSQLKHLKSWQAVLVGESRAQSLLSLPAGVSWIRDDVPSVVLKALRKLSFILDVTNPLLERRLRCLNVNLVHAHFATEAVQIWPTVRKLNVPMVVTLHGADISISEAAWLSGRQGWTMRCFPRKLRQMAQIDGVTFIAVSEAIKRIAISRGIPAEKIVVSYIGVDVEMLSTFRRADSRCQEFSVQFPLELVFVGRIVEKKGLSYLIQALSQLQALSDKVSLTVIGDGDGRSQAQALAERLGVKAISFTGALPHERTLRKLAESDVLVLPSIKAQNGDEEGLGIVLLEAQAMGIPVITSSGTSTQEAVLPGVSGLLVPQKDSGAIAAAIRKYLEAPRLLSLHGREAKRHVEEKFNLIQGTHNLERIYSLRESTSRKQ